MGEKKKNIAPPEKFFKPCVTVWFNVFKELVPPIEVSPGVFEEAMPSFVGAETRHMKSILKELRQRAEKKNIIWTEQEATTRFELFLRRAWEDVFISKNFMLRIISNNRTKIFNNQITKKNGSEKDFRNNTNRTTTTSDSKIRALAKWGLSPNKSNG